MVAALADASGDAEAIAIANANLARAEAAYAAAQAAEAAAAGAGVAEAEAATLEEAMAAFRNSASFKRYFHKIYKACQKMGSKQRSNPDLDEDAILEAFKEGLLNGAK